MMDIKGFDILYLSLFRWDNEYGSIPYYLSRELVKKNRIFFINQPLTLKDFMISSKWWKRNIFATLFSYQFIVVNKSGNTIFVIDPPIILSINWLPPGKIYRILFLFNQRRIQKSVVHIFKKYNIGNHLYINCFSPYYLKPHPNCKLNIYQCIDDLSQVPYSARHGIHSELSNMQRADLILVTSQTLTNGNFSSKTRLLPNAVDFDYFSHIDRLPIEKPDVYHKISNKSIGFIGNLDGQRIDYILLEKIAHLHPDKTLLLIGPINSPEAEKLQSKNLKNVIWRGPISPEEVPIYLKFMDCVIIPFLCNQLTAKIYPLKINEYLAMGKPVISSKFSIDIASFSEVIHLVDNHDQFCQMIDIALFSPKDHQRMMRIAQSNSWSARIQQLGLYIDEFVKKTIHE